MVVTTEDRKQRKGRKALWSTRLIMDRILRVRELVPGSFTGESFRRERVILEDPVSDSAIVEQSLSGSMKQHDEKKKTRGKARENNRANRSKATNAQQGDCCNRSIRSFDGNRTGEIERVRSATATAKASSLVNKVDQREKRNGC
jgi:hypothetical protein